MLFLFIQYFKQMGQPEKVEETPKPSMTVAALKDYILKHMTAEQALERLLSGSLIEYEKLKFTSEDKAIHPEILIAMAAMELGWQLMIEAPKEDEDGGGMVIGMVVGTEDYMNTFKPKSDANEQKHETPQT